MRSMTNVEWMADRSVMALLPLFGFGEKVAETVETAFPGRAALADPLLGGGERTRFDTTGSYPPDLLRPDEPARLQHLQVLDDAGERHVEWSGELADRGRSAAQAFHHRPPAGIGERLEHPVERGALVKHVLECRAGGSVSQAKALVFAAVSIPPVPFVVWWSPPDETEETSDMADLMPMVHAERASLGDFLDTLAPEQWTAPTWCDKWNVQELVGAPHRGREHHRAALLRRVRQGGLQLRQDRRRRSAQLLRRAHRPT